MSEEPLDSEEAPKIVLTVNQVVAYNLRAARALRGWTQEEAAAHLEPFLGSLWSRANFSAAERSSDPFSTRVRNFSADDIVAIAAAFELPVMFFFTPPPYSMIDLITMTDELGLRVDDYMRVTLGSDEGRGHWRNRLDQIIEDFPLLRDESTEALQAFVNAKTGALGEKANLYADVLFDVAYLFNEAQKWLVNPSGEDESADDDTAGPQSADEQQTTEGGHDGNT